MDNDLLLKLEELTAKTGLSEHRVGILCARNGRLIERLRNGGRVWPETKSEILATIERIQERLAEPPKTSGDAA